MLDITFNLIHALPTVNYDNIPLLYLQPPITIMVECNEHNAFDTHSVIVYRRKMINVLNCKLFSCSPFILSFRMKNCLHEFDVICKKLPSNVCVIYEYVWLCMNRTRVCVCV